MEYKDNWNIFWAIAKFGEFEEYFFHGGMEDIIFMKWKAFRNDYFQFFCVLWSKNCFINIFPYQQDQLNTDTNG